MTIRLITFDLDNTLWENDSVIWRAEKTCYEFLQQRAPELAEKYTLMELFQLRMEMIKQEPILAAKISDLRIRALETVLKNVSYEGDVSALAQEAFDCFMTERNRVELFDQSLPLLQQLRQNYTLISLTNGNSSVEAIGIDDFFDHSFSAEQLGSRKPEPDLFHKALECAQVSAGETVHIGDHPLDDVHGANQIGIYSIWFNPNQADWSEVSKHMETENNIEQPAEPTHTVHCLSEIPAVIKQLDQ